MGEESGASTEEEDVRREGTDKSEIKTGRNRS